MKKVKLYIINKSKWSLDELFSSVSLTSEQKDFVNKAIFDEVKKERILSIFLKQKYIKNIKYNQFGKPISTDCFFNISHSQDFIILAISDVEIGVDIEYIRPISNVLKNKMLTSFEKEYVKNNSNFFEIWTNKESLVKCIGTGIISNIIDIPGLPINGIRYYKDNCYISKTLNYENYCISIVLKTNDFFEIGIENIDVLQ